MDREGKHIGKECRIIANLMIRKITKVASKNDNIETCNPMDFSKKQALTPMQGLFIGYIFDNRDKKDIFQKDLESEFHIRRSTATEILKLMEKNGLILKEKVKDDARLKKIKLTEKAEIEHKEVLDNIATVEEKAKEGLSDKELDDFFSILKKINKNLE